MKEIKLMQESSTIKHHIDKFQKIQIKSIEIIDVLLKTFQKKSMTLSARGKDENQIQFTFWGLEFIIKSELSFNQSSGGFFKGELNTYLKKKKDPMLILSYTFDHIGNIENYHLLNEFADFYYNDFVLKLIECSENEGFKFQL